jgi:hypothetical protein
MDLGAGASASASASSASAARVAMARISLPGSRPAARRFWWKRTRRPSGSRSGRPATKTPAPRREWTSPSSPSAASERRTVWRFTPKRADSSASVGRRSPTAQWPRAISSASVPAMDFQIGVRASVMEISSAAVAPDLSRVIRFV